MDFEYFFIDNTMEERAKQSNCSRYGNADIELTREELQKLIDGECLVVWNNDDCTTVQITVKKE